MASNYEDFLRELEVFLKKEESLKVKDENRDFNLKEVVREDISSYGGCDISSLENVEFSNIKSDVISINELVKEDKPREKLLRYGVSSLSEHELIAILLRSGSKKEDVLSLSKKLWVYLSKLKNLSEIEVSDLMCIDGIGLSKASIIVCAMEFAKRISLRDSLEKFSVNSPKSVADIFKNILGDEFKEHFFVLLLNTKNKIISWQEISRGDLNSSIVHPREVFKYALKNGANSIICLHNHPSGDLTASREDIDITRRLEEVGNLVGIKLLDHIIIGKNNYVSLREKGLI